MYLSEIEDKLYIIEDVLQPFLMKEVCNHRDYTINTCVSKGNYYLIDGYDLVAGYLKGSIDNLIIKTKLYMIKDPKEFSAMIDVVHRKSDD